VFQLFFAPSRLCVRKRCPWQLGRKVARGLLYKCSLYAILPPNNAADHASDPIRTHPAARSRCALLVSKRHSPAFCPAASPNSRPNGQNPSTFVPAAKRKCRVSPCAPPSTPDKTQDFCPQKSSRAHADKIHPPTLDPHSSLLKQPVHFGETCPLPENNAFVTPQTCPLPKNTLKTHHATNTPRHITRAHSASPPLPLPAATSTRTTPTALTPPLQKINTPPPAW
jgi:hypothetical protein